ncbi:MAG: HAMP domain-containing histidine kinase [Coriobacteriales bacterium]|nr:HAMP domain-containing histidine kinase [Coriobacteriales bacterium]
MNKLPIKIKISLLFTALMTIIVVAAFVVLLLVGERLAINATQDDLVRLVTESRTDIEYEYGVLDFDDDLKFYENGVSLSVYNAAGQLLYGRQPVGLTPSDLPLAHAEMRIVGEGPARYCVYDMHYQQEGYGSLWVRGVLPTDSTNTAFVALMRLTAVILPILIVIGAISSYFVARSALKPVRRITQTAGNIADGGDLSQRISLGDGKDEIYALAATFDHMLDRLQHAFDKERQFTSDASHELRTPVSVIIAQCELALSSIESVDELYDALESVLEQARQVSTLIAHLLAFARADSNGASAHMETVNISELARSAAEQASEIAQVSGITLEADIEPGLKVFGDETLLVRMMWNLLENSVKYGNMNGVTTFMLRSDKDHIVGTVTDNGIGVAEEHLDKIWERFYRVDQSRSTDGFGLGLPMARYIAKAHGGSILATSTPGLGSVFTFKLPR